LWKIYHLTNMSNLEYRMRAFEAYHLPQISNLNIFARLFQWCAERIPCCGGSEGLLDDLMKEERMFQAVSSTMVTSSLTHYGLHRIHEDYIEDVFDYESTFPETDNVVEIADAIECVKRRTIELPVSSKVVSEVNIAIICKVGVLPDTIANRLVVDKTARIIMKSVNFRNEVTVVHLPHIINCYFNCRETQEIAGGRRGRCSKWLLRMMGFRIPSSTTA